MAQKKIENYGLYQTFSSNIPIEPLPDVEKEDLFKKIEFLSHEQKCAFFMLICEHARLNDNFQYDNTEDIILPYSIKQVENNVSLDFSKIPRELQWILSKFSNIIESPE